MFADLRPIGELSDASQAPPAQDVDPAGFEQDLEAGMQATG
jgi:hypothetical protein